MEETGVIFDIKKFAIHDGPGIRTTIFLKGCPLYCWWCHNPESQNFKIQTIKPKEPNLKISSNFKKQIGRTVSVNDVISEILKDRIFYEESGGGATFSGGEPLSQPNFLRLLLKECKKEGIHTTLDTCGYGPMEELNGIAKDVDLFLYDLKFCDSIKHEKYTGVSNKTIFKNLEMLVDLKKEIFIRIPIIPTINDMDDEIINLAEYILGLKHIQKIDLLPYHKIGKDKYIRLRMLNKMENIPEPTKDQMEKIKTKFESFGFNISVGG